MRLGYCGTINGNITKSTLEIMGIANARETSVDILKGNYSKTEHDGNYYYIVATENGNAVYKKLPNVVDDNRFTWRERKIRNRRRNLWSKVDTGKCFGGLEFCIMYYLDTDDVKVSVYGRSNYNPGDTFMIRKVKGNNDIVNGINDYIDDYKRKAESIEKLVI